MIRVVSHGSVISGCDVAAVVDHHEQLRIDGDGIAAVSAGMAAVACGAACDDG